MKQKLETIGEYLLGAFVLCIMGSLAAISLMLTYGVAKLLFEGVRR